MNARISSIQGAIAAVEADIKKDGANVMWLHREHAFLTAVLLLAAHPGFAQTQDVDLSDLDALASIVASHPTHPATQPLRQYLLGLPGVELEADKVRIEEPVKKQAREHHTFATSRYSIAVQKSH